MDVLLKISNIKRINESIKRDLEIVYPMTKSKRILLKILSKLREGISECINLALILEFKKGKIKKSSNSEENLINFFKFSKKDFKISDIELNKIKEVFNLARFQRKSEVDFFRGKDCVFLFFQGKFVKIKLSLLREYYILMEIIFQKIFLYRNLI